MFIQLLVQVCNSLQKQAAAYRETRLGSGERWSPFSGTALGANPKAIHSLADCDTTCGNLLYFPPFKDFEFLIYQEAFPVSFMKSLCQHGNNSNHLRLFFPCSLFLLQCDETGLVSFPFLNRQIHFLIFSHTQHSKKTAHGGDQNTSLKPFLLILCFAFIPFLFFLQHHGTTESKLGCQHHLKIDELF